LTTLLANTNHVLALGTAAIVGLVFLGLCVLGLVVVLGLFYYGWTISGEGQDED
jgi:hypothetical protein